MTQNNNNNNNRLHKLLRGELAAVESYERALNDVRDHPARGLLQRFLDDHRRAVSVLTRHIARAGEEPDHGAGPWGLFVKAVEKAASWIDDPTTLKALKEGEVHGLDEYRTAIGTGAVTGDLLTIVEGELLPRQQEHVRELDPLIKSLEKGANQQTLPDRVDEQRAGR